MVVDLSPIQSPSYRERGIARHALDFSRALIRRHPEMVERFLLHQSLPPVGGIDDLVDTGKVTMAETWSGDGGVYHILSPYELEVPVRVQWPLLASARGMSLVVTVYDLIPDLFPHIYLEDPGQRCRYRARHQLIRVADHVLTISESAGADVSNRLGIDPARVTNIGAGCSEAFRPPASRLDALDAARRLVDGLLGPFLVYNGAVEPRKNMERLVEAYARLPVAVRDRWQLVLVCRLDDLQRNHFQVRATQLGIEGRLVLTGFVADEVLVTLYQATDLMVFPSLYEGYGLPVVEANACGAPAIVSDTSSLREIAPPDARFDPTDVGAISAAIRQALTDHSLRHRLLAVASAPPPTWDQVADRAADVYRRLGAGAAASAPRLRRRRPRLAVVTPWPPAATGVATYSCRLVDSLRSLVDVDVYVDGDNPRSAVDSVDGFALPAAAYVQGDRVRGGYDRTLLCLGNSEFHAGALRLLRLAGRDAVVLAHDVRLTGLYRHGQARGAVPEGFSAALHHQYPQLDPEVGAGDDIDPGEATRRGLLMVREVIGLSERFLTTSVHAASLAAADALPADVERIGVLPYAYPPPRPRAAAATPGLIVSFGVVNESKQPHLLVKAFAVATAGRPAHHLAFVGPVSDWLRHELLTLAAGLDIAEQITVTGLVDDETYGHWLDRTALAVQLRQSSNGETSGAVADCLSRGVATLVSDAGTFHHLPEKVVAKVSPGPSVTSVASAIHALLADDGRRESLGRAAVDFVAANGFDQAARRLVEMLGLTRW